MLRIARYGYVELFILCDLGFADLCRSTQAPHRHTLTTALGHHRTPLHSELNYYSYSEIQPSGSPSAHGPMRTRHLMGLCPHYVSLPTRP